VRRVSPPLVFALAFLAAWFRLPARARDSFWAEDARIFSARALHTSDLPWSIFTPYDGYVHAVPQTLAIGLWATVPTEAMAVAFTAAACAITALVAALVFALTEHWRINRTGRLFLAFTTVMVPGLSYEVLGNLANAHWFLLWLAPFLLLARPRSWWTSPLLGLTALAVLSTEIQAALFLPLLLWRIRDRKRWPIVAGAVLGTAIQAVALVQGGRTTTGAHLPTLASVLDGYFLQVPLVGLTGSGEAASAQVAYSGWLAAYAAVVPFVVGAFWWAWRRTSYRLAAAGIVLASVIIWSAGYALNRASDFDFSRADHATLLDGVPLLRYAIVPSMLLFALIGLAIGGCDLNRDRLSRAIAVSALVVSTALAIVHYRVDVPTPRFDGPVWSQSVQDAQEECDLGAHTIDVRVAPLYGTWTLPLPCDRLPDR